MCFGDILPAKRQLSPSDLNVLKSLTLVEESESVYWLGDSLIAESKGLSRIVVCDSVALETRRVILKG